MRPRLKQSCLMIIFVVFASTGMVSARVDTLKDSIDVEDCLIYSYENCDAEETGENCRRFNGGSVLNMGVGNYGSAAEKRVLFKLPGWNDTIPDSSELKVYCYIQSSIVPRRLFVYPLTRQFFEGNENRHNLGFYPDPDSGATWLHAYLDVGDGDSVSWTSAGGDYNTGVACTTTINDAGRYFTFTGFNRILTYWDTSGSNYGFIIINENNDPPFNSQKIIKSSESGSRYYPLVLLYTADSSAQSVRRSQVIRSLLRN